MRGEAFTGRYFGTDGFRGEAGADITAEHAFKVGRVLGWYFGARIGKKCKTLIGKDTRLSSYMLEYSLAAGFTASGGDAYIMHVTTTPSVSYITRCDGFDCGMMISASHNPFSDNGIKLLNGAGEKMEREVIDVVERYLDGDYDFFGGDIPFASGTGVGRTVDYVAGRNRYTGHLISLSTCSYRGINVGLDAANGSAFDIARNVFDSLGARTHVIGNTPDGTNINERVGSTHIETLKALVKERGLDIGFAFDGDADRCISVDANGRVLTGDEELYVLAKYLKSQGALPNDRIVCTVMSNGGLAKSLERIGVSAEICDVGDKNVCDCMARCGAALGGERSGHIVLSKYESTGDGILTAVMMMEAVVNCGLDKLLKGYKPLAQISVSVPAENKQKAMSGVETLCDRLRQETGARIIVRPSGTEKAVRIMAESESEETCALVCKILISKIADNCP